MKHKKVKNINYKLFLISLERKSAKSSRYEAGDLTQNVRILYYETAEFFVERKFNMIVLINQLVFKTYTYLCPLKPRI